MCLPDCYSMRFTTLSNYHLIDWWCNVCLFTWWIDSRFLLQRFWHWKPVDLNSHRLSPLYYKRTYYPSVLVIPNVYSYVIRMHSFVIRMSLICIRLSSVCHSYVLVCHWYVLTCHPYVTRMYFYVIRMSLVCTRISSLLVCHPYVTHMWFYYEPF